MKAKASATATLADVRVVLTAPDRDQSQRKSYEAAQGAFLTARQRFKDRATPLTWAATVTAGRRLHAEYKRLGQARDARGREAAVSRAATDEGGQG
jgi:hypothetical protein